MRILLVSRFFPYIGGREVLVMSLAHKLSKEHQVVVATPDIGRVSRDFEIISNDRKSLKRCLKFFKPEIVNSHTFYLTKDLVNLTKKYKVPLVLTIHGDVFGFGSNSDKKLLKSLIPNLDFIVAVCKHGQSQMLDNGANSDKLSVIYPGIDTDIFQESRNKKIFRKAFQLPPNKFVFITPARMVKYKGIDTLLDAVAKLKDDIRSKSLFWITTPSTRYREDELNYTKEIFRKAGLLGIKDNLVISFSDYVSMSFAYKAANAFILPSFTEQLPISILEAMSSALPVICTNVGGVSEIINNSVGDLVEAGNVQNLVESIETVYKFPNLQKTSLAKKKVQKSFNANRMVNEYLNLYKKLTR